MRFQTIKLHHRLLQFLLLSLSAAFLFALVPGSHISAETLVQAKPTEVKIDPAKFDDYVGQYATPTNPDLVLSFFREGDKYYVQATNQGRIEIFSASESKF